MAVLPAVPRPGAGHRPVGGARPAADPPARRGKVATLGLRVGDTVHSSAGRRYLESVVPELVGTVRFDSEAVDAWYKEDEPVFVHPRNPYVRVDALRCTCRVRVEREGILLAESASPILVFETGLPTRYYFDRAAVNFDELVPSPTSPRARTRAGRPAIGRCRLTRTRSPIWLGPTTFRPGSCCRSRDWSPSTTSRSTHSSRRRAAPAQDPLLQG